MTASWFSWSCSRLRRCQCLPGRNRDLLEEAPQHPDRGVLFSIARPDCDLEIVDGIVVGPVLRGLM